MKRKRTAIRKASECDPEQESDEVRPRMHRAPKCLRINALPRKWRLQGGCGYGGLI